MKLVFSEDLKYLFPYWVVGEIPMNEDMSAKAMNQFMDIQEWLGQSFGPIGEAWGFEKVRGALPTGGARYNLRNQPNVTYSWRFRNKADAMLFKLTWDNK
jgi:hypothetical protein